MFDSNLAIKMGKYFKSETLKNTNHRKTHFTLSHKRDLLVGSYDVAVAFGSHFPWSRLWMMVDSQNFIRQI